MFNFFDPMDGSPPGSPVHGILQARILQCVVIPFSRGSFQPRDQTWVSCIIGRFFTISATREAHIFVSKAETVTFVPPWHLQNLEALKYPFHGNIIICINSVKKSVLLVTGHNRKNWLCFQGFDWNVILEKDTQRIKYDQTALKNWGGHYEVHAYKALLEKPAYYLTFDVPGL